LRSRAQANDCFLSFGTASTPLPPQLHQLRLASANARCGVTCPNAFASRWLVPRLPKWREEQPTIPLEIIGTDAVLDMRAGNADVAIRYARRMPLDLAAQEIFRDTFFPVCSPELLAKATRTIERAADLLHYPLIHFDWMNRDHEAPTWSRWLAAARSVDPERGT
jgi:LysR family transcriptional regulator, glycine cleavage system transcriptional activator